MNQVLTRQPPPPTEPAAAARQKPLDELIWRAVRLPDIHAHAEFSALSGRMLMR
jgi:hypothetical protein